MTAVLGRRLPVRGFRVGADRVQAPRGARSQGSAECIQHLYPHAREYEDQRIDRQAEALFRPVDERRDTRKIQNRGDEHDSRHPRVRRSAHHVIDHPDERQRNHDPHPDIPLGEPRRKPPLQPAMARRRHVRKHGRRHIRAAAVAEVRTFPRRADFDVLLFDQELRHPVLCRVPSIRERMRANVRQRVAEHLRVGAARRKAEPEVQLVAHRIRIPAIRGRNRPLDRGIRRPLDRRLLVHVEHAHEQAETLPKAHSPESERLTVDVHPRQ